MRGRWLSFETGGRGMSSKYGAVEIVMGVSRMKPPGSLLISITGKVPAILGTMMGPTLKWVTPEGAEAESEAVDGKGTEVEMDGDDRNAEAKVQ